MEVVIASEVPEWKQDKTTSIRPGGTIRQSLLNDEAPDGLNFKLFRSQFQPGSAASTTPRHRHSFQQVRWAESGRVNYSPGYDIPAGDLAYFPRGAYYGPQLKDQGISIALQLGFGGEHQYGKSWQEHQGEAMARLNSRGTFEAGTFVETDPETGERRETDGVQAIYEEQYELYYGKKFVVPANGYDAPILMHAAAFDYFELERGVEIKRFGSFFDHPGPNGDIRLSRLRLSGGNFTLGPERAQMGWSINEGLRLEGRLYPQLTFFYSPRDEKLELAGVSGTEVNLVEFPRLD